MGKRSVAEYLIARGVDINAQDQEGGTALMWAVARKHPECVKLLLRDGANRGVRRKSGETAMDLAKRSAQLEMVSLLKR